MVKDMIETPQPFTKIEHKIPKIAFFAKVFWDLEKIWESSFVTVYWLPMLTIAYGGKTVLVRF